MRLSFLLLVSFCLCEESIGVSQPRNAMQKSANQVLSKVSQKLNGLKNIRYNYRREINYFSEHYHNVLTGNIYFSFHDNDTILGLKYQMESNSPNEIEIFNGTEQFTLDKQDKTIKINEQPKRGNFSELSLFYNSILTLKNALPIIVSDNTLPKSVADTIINKTPYYLVRIQFNNLNVIDPYLGKTRSPFTDKKAVIYTIIINKDNYLPIGVLQTNNLTKNFVRTSFTNIKTNTVLPNEFSWYYSTYTKEYIPAKPKVHKLISVDSYAPNWTLPQYKNGEGISLNDYKGEVVLLDFWIKNCGPCIASVPHLNDLQKKYGKDSFKILSINSYDSKENIKWFLDEYKPDYPILINGKYVAKEYGVWAFPTTILVDKNGKVIYSGGFDQSILNVLIKKSL